MNFDFSTIQNAAAAAWGWTSHQAAAIGSAASSFGTAALQKLSPVTSFISEKIQAVWNYILPYFGMAADFLKSNLGIATMLLGGTILCLALSRETDNAAASVALQIAGVVSAVAAGALLVGASVLLPGLPLIAYRVV